VTAVKVQLKKNKKTVFWRGGGKSLIKKKGSRSRRKVHQVKGGDTFERQERRMTNDPITPTESWLGEVKVRAEENAAVKSEKKRGKKLGIKGVGERRKSCEKREGNDRGKR